MEVRGLPTQSGLPNGRSSHSDSRGSHRLTPRARSADHGPGRLTCSLTTNKVTHMKTTLNIDDSVMARLRREAARSGRTMSELVEIALRQLLQSRSNEVALPELPSFDSGGALVDVADRDALHREMEWR